MSDFPKPQVQSEGWGKIKDCAECDHLPGERLSCEKQIGNDDLWKRRWEALKEELKIRIKKNSDATYALLTMEDIEEEIK